MEIKVYNQKGEETGTMTLPGVFDVLPNHDLLSQIVTSEEANARIPVAHVKNRAEVRGGGKKPWRQKGTGRARHGSIRSPIWKGGGVTHGPTKNRNFTKKINKKMAALALAMAVAGKAKEGEMVILDRLSIANGKTKEALGVVNAVARRAEFSGIARKSKLVVLPHEAKAEARAFRNLKQVSIEYPASVTARELLKSAVLVASQSAIETLGARIEKALGKTK